MDELNKKLKETNERQIENILREVTQGIVSFGDIYFVLWQRSDSSQETAKMVAKEIIKKSLHLV